jgi:dUTP pyrophosphatase
MTTMNVKLLRDDAIVPSRATPSAAGLDLYSVEPVTVHHGQNVLVPTGVAVQLPADCVGLINSRSGLSLKNGVAVMAGVIDSDYRGEVKVLLTKVTKGRVEIEAGRALVQPIEFVIPSVVDTLGESFRGERGFGSSDW